MECPVCLMNKPATSLLSLECGHGLCLRCSGKWLRNSPTCPLCRKITLVCSRSTRSREKSEDLLRFMFSYEKMIRDLNINVDDVFPDTIHVVRFLDTIFVQEKHLWYRPDMYSLLQPLKNTVRAIISSSQNRISAYEKEVLKKIIEM